MLGYHPLPVHGSPEFIARCEPTLPNLVKHVKAYGLSNKRAGYRGREKTYTTYKAFAKDPAAEVALAFLSEAAYVQFVEMFGERAWVAAAKDDHAGQRAA
jgi:hypothetical protein